MSQQHIELIVRGILIHQDHLLLCQNRKHGHLFLPGGRIEYGEPARHALQREIEEELGLRLSVGAFLGACEASFQQRGRTQVRHHHELNLLFNLIAPDGFRQTDAQSKEEHIVFRWVEREELDSLELLPRGIATLIRGGRAGWVSFME